MQLIFFFLPIPLSESSHPDKIPGYGIAGLRPCELAALLGMDSFQAVAPIYTSIASMLGFLSNTLVMPNFKTFAKLVGVKWFSVFEFATPVYK